MSNLESETTEFKLSLIANHARRDKNKTFISLAHLLNVAFLRSCFLSLGRNKARGIDNVSWNDYNENLTENLENLVARLKRKSFKPVPARRIYILKENGKERPLGISAIENKIVECGIKRILEVIYEQDFTDQSHGFRPNRSCHTALKQLNKVLTYKPVNHIVECDIKGFFDNVTHENMMDFLRRRVKDSSMLYLIEKFLRAGYIDSGIFYVTERGTPQGSILSPLLANIYLHYVLDEWFEKTVKRYTKGYCEIIRYADDFICAVQLKEDVEKIARAIQNRFNRYGLEIQAEKSRNISFGKYEVENSKKQNRKSNTFDFLGFTHYCSKSRRGNFKVGRKTQKKRFATACKKVEEWLTKYKNRIKTHEIWKTFCAKLRGHFQYYGVSENGRAIRNFYYKSIKMLHKCFNRRSQRSKISWERMHEYLSRYPLPKPTIKVSFYQ